MEHPGTIMFWRRNIFNDVSVLFQSLWAILTRLHSHPKQWQIGSSSYPRSAEKSRLCHLTQSIQPYQCLSPCLLQFCRAFAPAVLRGGLRRRFFARTEEPSLKILANKIVKIPRKVLCWDQAQMTVDTVRGQGFVCPCLLIFIYIYISKC